MPLILPHLPRITRHTAIPWLWRARCVCGWEAFAPSEERAKLAATSHVESEEAFPDYSFLGETPPEQPR